MSQGDKETWIVPGRGHSFFEVPPSAYPLVPLVLLFSCLFSSFSSPTPTATCTKRKQRRHSAVNSFPRFCGSHGLQAHRKASNAKSTTMNTVIHCRKILKARSNRETSSKTRYFWPFQSENASSFPARAASHEPIIIGHFGGALFEIDSSRRVRRA